MISAYLIRLAFQNNIILVTYDLREAFILDMRVGRYSEYSSRINDVAQVYETGMNIKCKMRVVWL